MDRKIPEEKQTFIRRFLVFLPDKIRELFLTFSNEIAEKYKVYNNYPRFEKTTGWTYEYCRGYRIELLYVTIGNGYFTVLGVKNRR